MISFTPETIPEGNKPQVHYAFRYEVQRQLGRRKPCITRRLKAQARSIFITSTTSSSSTFILVGGAEGVVSPMCCEPRRVHIWVNMRLWRVFKALVNVIRPTGMIIGHNFRIWRYWCTYMFMIYHWVLKKYPCSIEGFSPSQIARNLRVR